MTVKELIEHLEHYPKDAKVLIDTPTEDKYLEVDDVTYDHIAGEKEDELIIAIITE